MQQIYDTVCYACNEPGGFVFDTYSQAQFLNALAVVLLDFTQRAALYNTIFTTMINAGVAEYTVPDAVQKPMLCFVGGKLIEKVTEADLTQGHFEWRRQWGIPRQWHEDNLAPKRLELFPKPDFNGANIAGSTPPIGEYGDFYPADRNLTIVGPAAPSKVSWSLSDTLDGIPDSFTHYLAYGVLEQIFSSESELRDIQKAAYCRTRFQEAFSIADCIGREELMEED